MKTNRSTARTSSATTESLALTQRVTLALVLLPSLALPATASGGSAGAVTVHTAFGGFILGYDVDRNGTEGILCEAVTLPDGKHDVAVETFDQATGAIVKVVRRLLDTEHDFITLGIAGPGIGLVEFEHVNLIVDHRRYVTLNPLSGNAFTAAWTPPIATNDLLIAVSDSQEAGVNAFLAASSLSGSSYVFSSNVGANTFGPVVTVTNPVFSFNDSPVIAFDRARNQAVLAASNGCPACPPTIGLVDLATGQQSTFAGLGFGYANGIAVDPATRVACTATEIDFHVQFYDLETHTGISVPIPGATSQAQSGQGVAIDPMHRLFLIGQVFSSHAGSGSSILVFDEQGGFVQSIDGLALPASPVRLAINPSTRTGFVVVASSLDALQTFTY
jgi:hypothetical protein